MYDNSLSCYVHNYIVIPQKENVEKLNNDSNVNETSSRNSNNFLRSSNDHKRQTLRLRNFSCISFKRLSKESSVRGPI